MLLPSLLLSAMVAVSSPTPVTEPQALDAFANAWSAVDGYSATLQMHEISGTNTQDRTYSFTFAKPTSVTMVITHGPGRGGKVVWSGGTDVIGSPPGFLSGLKIRLAISDPRVTSLRGDTVAMASFGWILDHFRTTSGTKAQAPGPTIDGSATTAISLAVADPTTDGGVTREVLLVSDATRLPVRVERYTGTQLVKDVDFREVVVQKATAAHARSGEASTPPQ